jgi:hypothetical protein
MTDALDTFRQMLAPATIAAAALNDNESRVVVMDVGCGIDGWPTHRVYYEPLLEPGDGWRCIEVATHADAVTTAHILAGGDLPIEDRTAGNRWGM